MYDFGPNAELQNGRLFVAGNVFATGPPGIWVWNPDGNHIGTIVMPEQPANLNWGEADYRTLYITAKTSVYRLKMKTRGFINGAAN